MSQKVIAKLVEMSVLMGMIAKAGSQKAEYVGAVKIAASECIGQSIVHRNTTPANELLKVVSKHHKATLVAYFEKFGNFAWMKAEDKLAFYEGDRKLEWTEEYAKQVLAFDWEDARKPTKVRSEYDVEAEFSRFMEQVKTAIKKGLTVKNADLIADLEAAKARYVITHYEDGMVKSGPSGAPKQEERVKELADTAAKVGSTKAEPTTTMGAALAAAGIK